VSVVRVDDVGHRPDVADESDAARGLFDQLVDAHLAGREAAAVAVQRQRTVADVGRRGREAEAEVAKLSQSFNMDVTTDFGQLEDVIQRKIDANRGKARVASDLSSEGIDHIKAEERMEASMADDALKDLEVELGMRAPETTPVVATAKDLGPAETEAPAREPEKVTE